MRQKVLKGTVRAQEGRSLFAVEAWTDRGEAPFLCSAEGSHPGSGESQKLNHFFFFRALTTATRLRPACLAS